MTYFTGQNIVSMIIASFMDRGPVIPIYPIQFSSIDANWYWIMFEFIILSTNGLNKNI